MEPITHAQVDEILRRQKAFFSTGKTLDVSFRIAQLKRLKAAVRKYDKRILEALWTDLGKCPEEAFLTESGMVNQEINHHLRHIRKWIRPKRVPTTYFLLPSKSRVIHEPLGVALVFAPWNYPFQLMINPVIGAISAGCCAVMKPSPYTPTVAALLQEMIAETFDPDYITLVQGGREVNGILLSKRFDMIFYTGSPAVGKVVMEAASRNLVPMVLELGGKSPCIVDETANLKRAARRIAWGKTINAGQTCIAPDYLLVQSSIKEELIRLIQLNIKQMYGENIRHSRHYPRIVSRSAMERLAGYLPCGTIRFGGGFDPDERFFEPTLLDGVSPDSPIMQDEIFGPILPVLTFESLDEAILFTRSREKPLALYYFGKASRAREVLRRTTSGGACINDTILNFANLNLPFGGVGNSGMGKYHHRRSFTAFSNERPILLSPTWFDLPVKYPPYPIFRFVKKLLSI